MKFTGKTVPYPTAATPAGHVSQCQSQRGTYGLHGSRLITYTVIRTALEGPDMLKEGRISNIVVMNFRQRSCAL